MENVVSTPESNGHMIVNPTVVLKQCCITLCHVMFLSIHKQLLCCVGDGMKTNSLGRKQRYGQM